MKFYFIHRKFAMMQKTIYPIILVVILLLTGCKGRGIPDGVQVVESGALGKLPKIELGFNAKGALKPAEQARLFDELLDSQSAELKKHLHVRVTGGTVSQRVFPADWSNGDLKTWIDLQKKHGFGLVYVLNGNDTPQSQAAFITKWIDMGARFTFLEMMNEYYLSKYQKGDRSKPGVGKAVDCDLYTNDIIPSYAAALQDFELPIFLIFAPMKGKGKVDDYNQDWNEGVAKFMKQGMEGFQFGAAVHLYTDGGDFDYGQLDRLREMLPDGTPIAVSECGLAVRESDLDQVGKITASHYRQINAHLVEGDYLFDHVLYNNYSNDNSATLHPQFKGLTPKGRYVIEWMQEIYP
jgi:hypothetical protein